MKPQARADAERLMQEIEKGERPITLEQARSLFDIVRIAIGAMERIAAADRTVYQPGEARPDGKKPANPEAKWLTPRQIAGIFIENAPHPVPRHEVDLVKDKPTGYVALYVDGEHCITVDNLQSKWILAELADRGLIHARWRVTDVTSRRKPMPDRAADVVDVEEPEILTLQVPTPPDPR